MTSEYNAVLEAKKSIKAHIAFFESLLKNLNSTDKILRNGSMWATWCLHRYIEDKLMTEIENAIKENGVPELKHNA